MTETLTALTLLSIVGGYILINVLLSLAYPEIKSPNHEKQKESE